MAITVQMNRIDRQADLRQLRALLKRQFPHAHREAAATVPVEKGRLSPMGIPALDAAGLPETGLIELVGAEATGVNLVVWGVIRQLLISGHAVALVDGGDGYDVIHDWPGEITARLLWVRCRGVDQAVRAVDLLVRDGNVKHLVMDLHGTAKQAIPVPGPAWYRLRNAAEETGMWLLVTSRQRSVPCAAVRCHLTSQFGLDALSRPREILLGEVTVETHHRRGRSLARAERRAPCAG